MTMTREFGTFLYAQLPLVNDHTDLFSKTRCLHFDLSLHIHSYFVYAISECSCVRACMHVCAYKYAHTRLSIRCALMQ